ncbi:DegT/DnrJ/EryC1/StrS family aminotransferase [Planococcus sp. 1R117A]|uniref:DegT/DnrJ/EryC1/StrS family aminotransferase n=1 Tax=Planococcus sp. 1R117A TaxID=3447020 RepID=UPI003EDC35CC
MKKIYVSKPSLPSLEEYTDYLKLIWGNHHLTNNGPLHQQFEVDLKKHLSADNISLFTNGHLALEAALQVLDLEGEVITTPFTFASTIHAIVRSGLKPVFCDIEVDNFNIDTSKIEELINERTSAILAVHVFGVPCNVEAIQRLADKYNLKVIYDAAHAFGVTYKGKPVSSYGDISMFSFHATKVFHSIEGGALVFKNSNLNKNLSKIKNFGIENEDTVDMIGFNAKMNEFQASMGLLNLKKIREQIQKRKQIVNHYNERLGKMGGILIPPEKEGVINNYAYYPIIIKESNGENIRNHIHEKLGIQNVVSRKYFYPLCSNFECYKMYKTYVPIAEKIGDSILVLPLYDNLTSSEVNYICDSLEVALKEA